MDLASLLSSMSLNDSKIRDFEVNIEEHSTRIVVVNCTHEPHDLIIISQQLPEVETYTLHKLFMNRIAYGSGSSLPVYGAKPLSRSSAQTETTALYIAEQLEITKPVMLFLQLNDYNSSTVAGVVEAIKNYPG